MKYIIGGTIAIVIIIVVLAHFHASLPTPIATIATTAGQAVTTAANTGVSLLDKITAGNTAGTTGTGTAGTVTQPAPANTGLTGNSSTLATQIAAGTIPAPPPNWPGASYKNGQWYPAAGGVGYTPPALPPPPSSTGRPYLAL